MTWILASRFIDSELFAVFSWSLSNLRKKLNQPKVLSLTQRFLIGTNPLKWAAWKIFQPRRSVLLRQIPQKHLDKLCPPIFCQAFQTYPVNKHISAFPSATLAAVTTTLKIRPKVSTKMWRFQLFTFLFVTIQPPLNTYDFRPRRGQRFVEMHWVDINSRPRRGRTFVSTLFFANLRPLRVGCPNRKKTLTLLVKVSLSFKFNWLIPK